MLKRRIHTSYRRRLYGAAAVCLAMSSAQACSLELLSGDSLTLDHPGTISIAMAVHGALSEGAMEPLAGSEGERTARLLGIRILATRHMTRLLGQQVRNPGSPVYVLLTQSGAWMTLGGDGQGPAYHTEPPPPDAPIVLIPDLAYEALLQRTMSNDELERRGLVLIFAEEPNRVRDVWTRAIDAFRPA